MDNSLQYQRGPVKEEAKYRPFILRRLTDMEPQVKKEAPVGLVTVKQLKEDIFNNIEMLFNSRCHTTFEELKNYGDVENSVLGFGIKDFCGRTNAGDYKEILRQHIIKQLRTFEPRLEPSSISVDFSQEKYGAVLEYEISGVIRLKEADDEVRFFSNLDLESGNASLFIAED
ncbi:MAG: type VI secretion system baseplate subunit TssE [Spirochaetaceae bacterium]|jgi:type VI secretion system protein ImpF|nr:type VI secretion system baseplate subunit TssE [Spirochaetaceae bacterium]